MKANVIKSFKPTTLTGLLIGFVLLFALAASPAYADEATQADEQGVTTSAVAGKAAESPAKSIAPTAEDPSDSTGATIDESEIDSATTAPGSANVDADADAEKVEDGVENDVQNVIETDSINKDLIAAEPTTPAENEASDSTTKSDADGTKLDEPFADEGEIIVLSEEDVQRIEDEISLENQASLPTVPVHWIAYYDDAYSNLAMVNAARSETRTDPNPSSSSYGWSLGSLTWDSNLEHFAVMRAIELAVQYSHTRPNGTRGIDGISADFNSSGYSTKGENIAYGQSNVAAAHKAWYYDEKNGLVSQKGHYHNICNANYRSMACACISSGGYKYYVQVFSSSTGNRQRAHSGAAVGGDSNVEVTNASDIKLSMNKTTTLTIAEGDTYQLNPDDKSGYYIVGKNITTGQSYEVASWYLDWAVSSGSTYASIQVANNNPYYVRITGKSPGTATIKAVNRSNANNYMTFNVIVKRKIANAKIAFANQTYTGFSHTPAPTRITYNGSTLSSSDYFLYYSNNVNAGTATVTIRGNGNYTGETTKTFIINKADISNVNFSFPYVIYTSSALKPSPSAATFNGMNVLSSSNYELGTYANNVNAGTASVVVKGKGNFTGTATKTFLISPANISSATIAMPSTTYTGAAQNIAPSSVVWNGRNLSQGTDYALGSYSNNVNAGTASMVVTGKGNFTGKVTKTFAIKPANISSATITMPVTTYTGKALNITPISVVWNNKNLAQGADYTCGSYTNNVNVGTASVVISGKGNFTGNVTKTFTVNPAHISNVAFVFPAQTYTGKALTPAPSSATFYGLAVAPSQYTVGTYSNNVNAGTASVILTGKNNFTGSVTRDFTINKANIANVAFAFPSQTYTGKALTPAPSSATFNGGNVASSQYTVGTYSNNVNAGTASVAITGKGNFTGNTTKTFAISPAKITAAMIAAIPTQTYDGSAKKPLPTVTFNGRTLTYGSDYTVAYRNNTNAGAAEAVVSGKGNFASSATTTFDINPSWKRLWGQNAIGTMQQIMGETFADGSCQVAVIATMNGYWDALTASGLAGLNKCPVLLTDQNTLSAGTADELQRLNVTRIYIVGGTAAVSKNVENQLANSLKIKVTRLAGQNAVETANSIANEMMKTKKSDTCIIATSNGFYDALSIAPYAYHNAIPVLLTAYAYNGVANSLTDDTVKLINAMGSTHAIIVGGSAAVDKGTETRLANTTKVKFNNITRLGGANAWQTSNAIAEWGLKHGMKADSLAIADGNGYWDALTGAALCGMRGSVLLLVPHNDASVWMAYDPYCIDHFLADHKAEINRGYFFGGTAVVPESTANYARRVTMR